MEASSLTCELPLLYSAVLVKLSRLQWQHIFVNCVCSPNYACCMCTLCTAIHSRHMSRVRYGRRWVRVWIASSSVSQSPAPTCASPLMNSRAAHYWRHFTLVWHCNDWRWSGFEYPVHGKVTILPFSSKWEHWFMDSLKPFYALLCILTAACTLNWKVLCTVKRPEIASECAQSHNNTVNAEAAFFSGPICM